MWFAINWLGKFFMPIKSWRLNSFGLNPMKILWAPLIFCVSCHSDKRSDTTTEIHEETEVSQTQKLKIEPDVFVIEEEFSKQFGSGKNLDFFQSKNDNAKLFLNPYTDGAIITAVLTRSELLHIIKN